MNHGVAIWANWDEILDWINHIVFTDLAQRYQVVDMDEALAKFAVLFPEIDCANDTGSAVMSDAFVSSVSIPFVSIHKDLCSLTFLVLGTGNILVSEDWSCFYFLGTKRPVDSNRVFYRAVGYRVTDTSECEGSTIFSSIEHKNPILAGYEILNGLLPEMGLILPMPD